MSIEEIFQEIKKHDLTTFQKLEVSSEELSAACDFLNKINRKDMSVYLKKMAIDENILIGPVDGFLAAAVEIEDVGEKIIMSNKYEKYNNLKERVINLVHEIGAVSVFEETDLENDQREDQVRRWLELGKNSKEVELEVVSAADGTHREKKQPVEDKVEGVIPQTTINKNVLEDSETPRHKDKEISRAKNKRSIIDALLAEGLLTDDSLQDAKDKSIGTKKPIITLLIEMGFITEQNFVDIAPYAYHEELNKLANFDIDVKLIEKIPYITAKENGIFPIKIEDDSLLLAVSDPLNVILFDDIRGMVEASIKPILCSPVEINNFINEYYNSDDAVDMLLGTQEDQSFEVEVLSGSESAEELLRDMAESKVEKKVDNAEMPAKYKALLQEESPTVKLVNLILSDAVKSKASDIHIEPREKVVEIRYRIDGDLKNIMKIPSQFHIRMVARIKILSELDITQNVQPQDGRINLSINKKKVDFRVSTIPTYYGEKVVMRILDPSEAKTELRKVGFSEEEEKKFVDAIGQPQGMVFVTGPTGSGKTSTLYAALNHIRNETTNIITIEDPIEFVSEGINQIQVNPTRGVTFANGLRSILRQDPNVILIGEIRDKETAEIAVKASLTGHLVLTTLHTNNAVATITRLADIGLDYYQIASSVLLILSQRLIKLLCNNCKYEYQPEKEYLEKYKAEIEAFKIDKFFKGRGCDLCNFSGYSGRTAVFEILKMNEKLKDLIAAEAPEEDLRRVAKETGLVPLLENGLNRVKRGFTTLDEVSKVLGSLENPNEDPLEKKEEGDFKKNEAKEKKSSNPVVLVVDDEDDIRKVIVKYLTMDGFEVLEAINGKEAVAKAFKEKPDLIITDVMMPEMDGYEATKFLRSKLETASIPIMMLTAKRDKESEIAGIEAGVDDYLVKPFDKDKLIARVKMLLRRRG